MLCPYCSQAVPDGASVCPDCGQALAQVAPKARIWPPMLIMGILFTFGLILYFFTSA